MLSLSNARMNLENMPTKTSMSFLSCGSVSPISNISILQLSIDRDVKRISKVPGLGEVSALAGIAEMGDPNLFQNDKQVD